MNTGRIHVIDALRGLALLAILLANLPFKYEVLPPGSLDYYLDALFIILIDKKFLTLFSILFGFGFYMQMEKAETSSVDFRKYFLIRMFILFVIGAVHGYVLWFGDILKAYAIGGMLLLLLYKLPTRKLFYLAVVFNVLLTGVFFIGNDALGWQQYRYDYSLPEKMPLVDTYGEYFRINFIINPWTNFFQDLPITIFFSFGNMIIGFLLARAGFFSHPDKKRLHAFMVLGMILGLSASFFYYLISKGTLELAASMLWLPFLLITGMVLQSLGYISMFVKFFGTKVGKALLSPFIPVGQMALTNYVLQSAWYILLFYHFSGGLRLFGKISLAGTYLTGIILFLVQVLLSLLWLRFFKQGPVEYAWKYVAYKFFRPAH
jgi:uncharacterized protein